MRTSLFAGGRATAARVVGAALGALTFGVPCTALAITLSTTVTTTPTQRDSAEDPFTVSYQDCSSGNELVFTLSALTIGSALSVWGTESSDCTSQNNRNQGLCTKVLAAFQIGATSMTLNVSEAAVAGALSGVTGCVDSGATDSPRPIKLYFLINETTDPVAEFSTYDTKVDLLGPPPPTDVSVGVADTNALDVKYTAPTSSTDVTGYNFYCEQVGAGTGGGGGSGGTAATGGSGGSGGTAATGGSGGSGGTATGGTGTGGAGGTATGGGGGAATGGTGGTATGGSGGTATGGTGGTATGGTGGTTAAGGSGGSGGAGACVAPTMVAGQLPPATATLCGDTTGASEGQAKGLTPGVEYAVGVAGRDKVGNVGKLSVLACGSTEPVDDFFDIYRRAGGQAGGGFCGMCAVGDGWRHAPLALGSSLLLGLGLLARRARSRRGGGRQA